MVKAKTREHFKFIFKVDELPKADPLPAGLSWSIIRSSDISLVLSRTPIPYKVFENRHTIYAQGLMTDSASMGLLPSAAITTQDGTPVAWVILGLDGSIEALQCEAGIPIRLEYH